ncbi:MAG: hypothetical protein ACK5MG_09745 [Bacteroidales bacterium]
MAYTNINLLKRIIDMQERVLELQQKHRGAPMLYIYRNYIKDEFHISKSTFSLWLGRNAKKELAELEIDNL